MKVIRLYLMHIMFEIISFLVYIYNGYGHKIAIILNTLYLFCSWLPDQPGNGIDDDSDNDSDNEG